MDAPTNAALADDAGSGSQRRIDISARVPSIKTRIVRTHCVAAALLTAEPERIQVAAVMFRLILADWRDHGVPHPHPLGCLLQLLRKREGMHDARALRRVDRSEDSLYRRVFGLFDLFIRSPKHQLI
jgi:hypothetical protein